MTQPYIIDTLIPKEPALFSSKVAQANPKSPIKVKDLRNGYFLIEDGHHRVRAAIQRGLQIIDGKEAPVTSNREASDLFDWASRNQYVGMGIGTLPLVSTNDQYNRYLDNQLRDMGLK